MYFVLTFSDIEETGADAHVYVVGDGEIESPPQHVTGKIVFSFCILNKGKIALVFICFKTLKLYPPIYWFYASAAASAESAYLTCERSKF